MTGAICCRFQAIVISLSLRSKVISNPSKQQQGQLQGVLTYLKTYIIYIYFSVEIMGAVNTHIDVVI